MTGSFWAPIIIPIVAVLALAAWLALVWYAAAHPRWKAHRVTSAPGVTRRDVPHGYQQAGCAATGHHGGQKHRGRGRARRS